MPERPASEDPDTRTARVVAAATAAARALGLTVTQPKVLHDVFSVVVHLAPSPVVARVPTVLPPSLKTDLAALATRQRLELDVTAWLAEQGHPVVTPSPLVPREPVQRDGFSMTFWQLVDQDRDVEIDYLHTTRLTASLHAALRDYPGDLPFLSSVDATIPECLTALETRPDLIEASDLDRAWQEWTLLEPIVESRAHFEATFPHIDVQPIHGDSPPFNIIMTTSGELYSDFEMVTLGPVEWDLTLLGPQGEAAYNTAAAQLGLRSLDKRVLRVMEAARLLQVIACLALVPQLPILADGLKPIIEQWRMSPIAGGLNEWL